MNNVESFLSKKSGHLPQGVLRHSPSPCNLYLFELVLTARRGAEPFQYNELDTLKQMIHLCPCAAIRKCDTVCLSLTTYLGSFLECIFICFSLLSQIQKVLCNRIRCETQMQTRRICEKAKCKNSLAASAFLCLLHPDPKNLSLSTLWHKQTGTTSGTRCWFAFCIKFLGPTPAQP